MELATTGRMLLDFENFQEHQRQQQQQQQQQQPRQHLRKEDSLERSLTTRLIANLGANEARTVNELPPPPPPEVSTGLTRRPRMYRPQGPPLPVRLLDDAAAATTAGIQLPLIADPRRGRGRARPSAQDRDPDRLAALSGRPRVSLRASTQETEGGRLARMSLGGLECRTPRKPPSTRMLVESAEDEGRSLAGVGAASTSARPFTAAAAAASAKTSWRPGAAVTRYVVINGRTRSDADDFEAFRRRHADAWGRVSEATRRMEQFLVAYSVPIAFVNGEKLADLAEALEFDLVGPRRPTAVQLLDCLINRSDVTRLVALPGRRFAGPSGVVRASVMIQACWRGHRQRRLYWELQRKRWAARVIAINWLVRLRLRATRNRLLATRAAHLDGYRRRFKRLAKSWHDWQRQRRVVVHIPSLGYSQRLRRRLKGDLGQLQSTQMARLCDIRDPSVDVVLLCPLPVGPELVQYYARLAALRAAIQSGNPDDQCHDADQRIRMIVPEAVGQFPQHRLCLSTLLNYSPVALRQIRDAVAGRRAYIVPGLPCPDDLAVADKLDLPILCPEPSLAHRFGGRSGSLEVLRAAQLATPPGQSGIASVPHLAESLARLITGNLDVKRWLVRLNESPAERDNMCSARVEPEPLACYQWAIGERQRYGEKWSRLWAQERVYLKLLEELESSALTAMAGQEFLDEFAAVGGTLEADIPDEAAGDAVKVTVDLCVEPTGTVKLVSTGDCPWVAAGPICVPQSALDPPTLADLCRRLGAACLERGLFGHLCVELVKFGDPATVWATELRLIYSNTAALTQLLQFASNGSLDPATHQLLSAPRLTGVRGRPKTAGAGAAATAAVFGVGWTPRYAALSAGLCHSGLSTIDYGVFFQLCKARGIGFDVSDLTGTLFCLVDTVRRDRICVLTVADKPERARREFACVLAAIDAEVGGVGTELASNFGDFGDANKRC